MFVALALLLLLRRRAAFLATVQGVQARSFKRNAGRCIRACWFLPQILHMHPMMMLAAIRL